MLEADASPKLYIWKTSRLYIGTRNIPFRNYTLAWSQLLVSIRGNMRVLLENGEVVSTRSCMVKAGTVVDVSHIDTSEAVIAIYYFNPIAQDFFVLESQMLSARTGVCYDHPKEHVLVQQLLNVFEGKQSPDDACRLCHEALVPNYLRQTIIKEFDPRVIETITSIRESFRHNLSVRDYAAKVNLSESRLNKLFKDQIGIPLTKYRLQMRLSAGVVFLASGYTVTEAAYASGFSNSAHFSRCFSDMIGIKPSSSFLKPPFVNAFICEEALGVLETAVQCSTVRRSNAPSNRFTVKPAVNSDS
jgi:AraC-like DNA-binding protein